ncbi:MAG: phosphoribosylaminoimidazolesuccinocarboxamide synthase [Proteobacteria bacterium]|nr:phosphoribosylaminoimidazolesuccinocarboxamide synthase [Pseudomonadota bacterium]
MDRAVLRRGLGTTLERTDLAELGQRYQGKVRDNYSTAGGERIIVVSDRISAFDRVLGTLPFKGQVLNQVAAWWFEQTRALVPNHVLEVPDPSAMVVRECRPLQVEMVVRGYLTGVSDTSIWTAYEKGEREFCGHRLPDGLIKHQRLPEPLLTPTTKAAHGAHDRNVSREEIVGSGTVSARDFDRAAAYSLALFAHGQSVCRERGLILVDTKYEFGYSPEGELLVIDEIHTPDSSRYWFADSYEQRCAAGQDPESFDKEYVRRWLAARGFRGEGHVPEIPGDVRIEAAHRYIEACDAIRGAVFTPDLEPPLERLRSNLRPWFGGSP